MPPVGGLACREAHARISLPQIEPAKARAFFEKAVQTVRGAALDEHPRGCLMLATATGSLLQLDNAAARQAGWARRPGSTIAAQPMPPELRLAGLQHAAISLERGQAAAAATAGTSPEEISHLYDSRAQVATFLSEEFEALVERAGSGGGPDEARARGGALEQAERAVALWKEAGRVLLDAAAAPEVASAVPEDWEAAAWEAEPDVDLLCALASACLRHGRLLIQWTEEVGGPSHKAGETAVERALQLYSEACSRCDSAKGDAADDVLRDWAQALWDAAALAVPAGGKAGRAGAGEARVSSSVAAARALLIRAASKAADSVGLLAVPLASSCNLLGDTLSAAADLERDEIGRAADAAGAADAAAAALSFYQRSVREGYERALRISSRDLQAQIGAADARLSIARLHRQREGAEAVLDGGAGHGPLSTALALYDALLRQPVAEWLKQSRQVNEYVEARYNACCALALASTPTGGRVAECSELLAAMMADGDTTVEEVAFDEDFAHLRECEWLRRALGRE